MFSLVIVNGLHTKYPLKVLGLVDEKIYTHESELISNSNLISVTIYHVQQTGVLVRKTFVSCTVKVGMYLQLMNYKSVTILAKS